MANDSYLHFDEHDDKMNYKYSHNIQHKIPTKFSSSTSEVEELKTHSPIYCIKYHW